MRSSRLLHPFLLSLTLLLSACGESSPEQARVTWSEGEKSLLQGLSIRHLPDVPLDPSNQYQQNPQAIALGKQLFFDASLSANGEVSCAFCHQPENHFSDGKTLASAIAEGVRNTPSLLGVSHQQWFFWDGRKDSAWSQALEPFENPAEHNLTRIQVIKKVLANPEYRAAYQAVFNDAPDEEELDSWPSDAKPNGDLASLKQWKALPNETRKRINRLFANIGKALAAFETTLRFPESRFDRYLDQLQKVEAPTELSVNEEQGLKLFIGKAACVSCHHSPILSNQHFQNVATGTQGKDTGRSMVAEAQRWDVFNCLGEFSDASKEQCKDLAFMNSSRNQLTGSFKVPSLRNVGKTAPYMHDGRYSTLAEAVAHYSNPPDTSVVDHHMPMIELDTEERQRLVDFLKTL
ncbi:c-type cytochrome [Leucothrix sargassi]|nr:c-type cytochrome [Leucothrix sargassi]